MSNIRCNLTSEGDSSRQGKHLIIVMSFQYMDKENSKIDFVFQFSVQKTILD